MAERLRAVGGFTYPADPESLRLVREAGGVSRLSPEARARVRLKRVEAGDFCDDMPEESVAIFLPRGEVERVELPDEPAVRRGRKAQEALDG